MKKITAFIFLGCFSFFFIDSLSADTLLLKNGGSFEGIVVEKTDEGIKFQVNIGTITVDNDDIAEIIKNADAENQNLQEDWQKQRDLDKAQALQQKQEEDKQEIIEPEKELAALPVQEQPVLNNSPVHNPRIAVNVVTRKAKGNVYLLSGPLKKPNKKLPLVIGLHWYSGNSIGFMDYWRQEVSKGDIIVACPKSIEQGWTEADVSGVMQMIDDIKGAYNIDKIYLVGHSSGANFALYLGLKYPKLFSAIAAVAGSITRARESIGKVVLYSAAGKHIPVLVYVGDKDTKQRVFNAEKTSRQLKQMGYPVEYKKVKDVTHVYMPWYTKEIRTWFEAQK